MKTTWITLFLWMLLGSAFAQTETLPNDMDLPKQNAPVIKTKVVKKVNRPQPCAVIERACKSGNFGKWTSRDCIEPILHNHDVPGVTTGDISLQQIKACRMYREDNLHKK
jgi:hypothetical protein